MPQFDGLLEELAEYFKETYFSPDLSGIVNFDTTDISRFLPLFIYGICIGIFAASVLYYYNCDYLGRVVRRLYKADATSTEKAKTLAELGCDKKLIRNAIKKNSVLSKYVVPTSESFDRFFIPEELKYIADKRFKAVRFGKKTLVLIFIACVALCFVLLRFTPEILQLADNAIGLIKNK